MPSYPTILNEGRRIAYAHSENLTTEDSSSRHALGVMFCGGFKSNMQGQKALTLEAFCHLHNIPFTRFDYSGHGNSEGEFIEGNIGSWQHDALCILDNIACKTSDKVIVVGSSMGAWIATLVAQQRPDKVAGLLTIAAAPDFTEKLLLPALSDAQLQTLKSGDTINMASDYDDGSPYPISFQLIEQSRAHCVLDSDIDITVPVRLLHGTSDSDVPYSLSIALMDAITSDNVALNLIKGADHRLSSENNLKTTLETLQAMLEELTR